MQTVHEVIQSYTRLTGDTKMVGYPQLREAVDLSWYDLFKKTRESVVRKWIAIERGGVIDWPDSMENLLGIYIENHCGDLIPLFEDNTKNTLPKLKRKCSCTQCDDDNCMCPSIVEVPVQQEVYYNSQYYVNKTTTRVLKNGQVVTEKEEWVPSYDSEGQLEGIVPIRSQVTTCNVTIARCGCIENTPENAHLLLGCGCLVDNCIPYLRDKYPALYSEYGYYKADYQTRKIHLFDSRGRKSKLKQAMFVYQSNGIDMMVPRYARPALIALLNWNVKMYSPLYNFRDREEAKRNYKSKKNEMIKYLNPIPYELISQAGDANAMLPYRDQIFNANRNFMHNDNCWPQKQTCDTTPQPIYNTVNHTTIVNKGNDFYNFDVPTADWTGGFIAALEGKPIKSIKVDGIGRKISNIEESDMSEPPEGTFFWKKTSYELIYRPFLNIDAWVEIEYSNT